MQAQHEEMSDLDTALRILTDNLDYTLANFRDEVDALFPLENQDDVIDYLTRMAYYRGYQLATMQVKHWIEQEFYR